MTKPAPDIIRFYLGLDPHPCGATFEEMLDWTDGQIEDSHDTIQWLFPTEKHSQANPDAPVLTYEDIQMFLQMKTLRSQQLRALNRFLRFFGLNDLGRGSITRRPDFEARAGEWTCSLWDEVPHSFLRVTRILDSLQLLGNHKAALATQHAFLQIADEFRHRIELETYDRWLDAVSRHGPFEVGPNMVRLGPMQFVH